MFAVVLAWLALLTTTRGAQASSEPCGASPDWSSLCNVEPELRQPFLMIEQVVDLSYSRDRLSRIVRDRNVTIDWDWNAASAIHLGAYLPRSGQVLVAARVRGEPARVEASILAHELWHAYGSWQGQYRPFTEASCLADERAAFMTGLLYYNRLLTQSGDARPGSPLDDLMMQIDARWRLSGGDQAALEAIADDHLGVDGYHQYCAQFGPSPRAA